MNTLSHLRHCLINHLQAAHRLSLEQLAPISVTINSDKASSFGDLSCNAALVLAKQLGKAPRLLAEELKTTILQDASLAAAIEKIELAGPGFLNIFLAPHVWQTCAHELLTQQGAWFQENEHAPKEKYLIEFVSANPTGPLHLGHGRGGIIGDVLGNVLAFLGNTVSREYYINDAGNQIQKLGASLKARYLQVIGIDTQLPEDGYAGEYLVDLANELAKIHAHELRDADVSFFSSFAKEKLLEKIKITLKEYGIEFDVWFSEKSLHDAGAVTRVLDELIAANVAYEQDGALWFRATAFGDDKDRVLRKSDGELTYIAADIAYHKNKFDRGFNNLINILGQDHHGYVKRLKATMAALGYSADRLEVILYQLVTITNNNEAVRMSKRSGSFTQLDDIIEIVGKDVARFFYLNRKADAHLSFDLAVALKKTEENPVFYIQYAYVRTGSILAKAKEHALQIDTSLVDPSQSNSITLSEDDVVLMKKIASLVDILQSIARSHQTHLLAYYSIELAQAFHAYYARNRVIDEQHRERSCLRLGMVSMVRSTLELCFDLLGISKPTVM